MLATSQKALKEYLHEAKEHKIIYEYMDDGGNTYIGM